MSLTTEERERRAYIEGNTELAAALGGEIALEQQLADEDDKLERVETELAEAREILALA